MLKIELIRFKPQDIVTASTLQPGNTPNTPTPVPGPNGPPPSASGGNSQERLSNDCVIHKDNNWLF